MTMSSGSQRLVQTAPGGAIMVARPQGQQPQPPPPTQQLFQTAGGQIVRTSGILVGGMQQARPQPTTQLMRPALPTLPASPASVQKLVINNARQGQPGSQITVPLATLQALQAGQGIPTGQPGHLLVKTETGQYQILRVGMPPPGPQPPGGQPHPTVVPSVPSIVTSNTGIPMQVSLNSTMPPLPTAPVTGPMVTRLPTQPMSNMVRQALPSAPLVAAVRSPQPAANVRSVTPAVVPIVTAAVTTTTSNATTQPQPTSASNTSIQQQMTPETAKTKCKNFLATLLRLASDQPESVAKNVRALIQGLIDGRVEPEVFTTKLQRELNSSPQPCLVPFLKKSLPYLQHSLATGEQTIDGVRPPSLSQIGRLPPITLANSTGPPLTSPTVVGTSQPLPPPLSIVSAAAPVLPTQPLMVASSTSVSLAGPALVTAASSLTAPPLVRPGFSTSSHPLVSSLATTSVGPPPISLSTLPVMPPLPTTPLPPRCTGIVRASSNSAVRSSPFTRPDLSTLTSPSPTINTSRLGLSSPFTSTTQPTVPNKSAPVIRDRKSGNSYSAAGDDDINDVAAMGGVNLQEEANKILGSTDNVGTVIRSCKDETFLQTGLLHQKIAKICKDKGLDAPSPEVINLISHATQERLKTLVSKLSVIAEHRLDIIKTEGPYEVTEDIKGQIRFLEDLDKVEKKRQEEEEREKLIRAAKSRTKTDDPEKEKMKAKAKEMQRLEQEQQRHSEANATALAAIGSKSKKFKFDENAKAGGNMPVRPRTKRVHMRDVMFLMEQEKDLKHSRLLFKSYCS